MFRQSVQTFVQRHVSPNIQRWDEDRLIDRETWLAAGEAGLIGLTAPEAFGGAGQLRDYRFRQVIQEELAAVGATALVSSFGLQDDIVLPYIALLGSEGQKERWLPGMCSGQLIGAIAMTEPGTGSDLRSISTTARKTAGCWILNGSKTFITSGYQADIVIVVARTKTEGRAGALSLLVVEDGTEGFSRGRKLNKMGQTAQDTAELFFDDVHVPSRNLLGEEGMALRYLMGNLPMERLSIAAGAVAASAAALEWTKTYVTERQAFGQRVLDFQNTRFTLADIATEVTVAQAFLDSAILAWNDDRLSDVAAAKAKLWTTEMQGRVVDKCVQLHGGYGYMLEYPIAKAYVDARVQRIYGGTSEIMREIIGRSLASKP